MPAKDRHQRRREKALSRITAEGSILVTPDEGAAHFRIGKTDFYDLLNSGAIPSFHLGRRRRIMRADLVAYATRLRDVAKEDT